MPLINQISSGFSSQTPSFSLGSYRIWAIGVSFVLFQFFIQLASGVIIDAIRQDMLLSALQAGLIGSAFYYIYTFMQIPVGLLFDRQQTRILLAGNAFLCSLGCIFFAYSNQVIFLIIGRIIIGAGASFAFVGLSHLLRTYYPLRKFGFMIGLSETLGFFIAMFGIITMGNLIADWGWRNFIKMIGSFGFLISFICWRFLPRESSAIPAPLASSTSLLPSKSSSPAPTSSLSSAKVKEQLFSIFKIPQAWINGFFVGLCFTVITVFGAMWAIPFIQVKLGCSLKEASWIDAMIFLGAAASCPLFALLASYFSRRKPLMISSTVLTTSLLLGIIFLPIHNHFLLGLLMFLAGLSCGAYMLAYSIANEISPKNALSTCTGFTNTLAMVTAPLLQPLVGLILDQYQITSHPENSLVAYQTALLVVPIAVMIGGTLILGLPEKQNYPETSIG